MANKPRQKRNEEIVRLHDRDPIRYSFANLARRFKNKRTGKPLTRSTIHEIYTREKARSGDEKAQSSGLIKSKYPSLITY